MEGKDEGKAMEPLFPRLHVNDREKGGPRAPPRNKMALYEHFSIPTKRFNSSASSSSSATIPPQKDAILAPSSPAIQANGNEKMVLSPLNMPPIPHSNSEERVHSRGMGLNATSGRSSRRHSSDNTSNARGPAPECSSHHLPGSNTKQTRGEDDDFCVPTFIPPEVAAFSKCDLPATLPEKQTTFHVERSQKSSSSPSSTLSDKLLEQTDANRNSRNYEQDPSEERCKETSVIGSSMEIPNSRRRFAEPSNWAKTCLDKDHTSVIHVERHSHHANRVLHLESRGNGYLGGFRCLNHVDVVEEEDDSRDIIGSCSKASLGNEADKFYQETHDKSNDQLQLGDGDTSEVSEASLVDSIAGMMVSPDDVVGVIGTKHFWKARRAIVNQQRVFAIQVFELHRLIKVQKLIAASPDGLKIDLYLKPSPPKVVSGNLPNEHIRESPSPACNIENSHQQDIEQNNLSGKLNQLTECQEEIPVRDPPQCEISKGVPHVINSAPETRPDDFHFQPPPPNQWLVPVMSPSEGLIYKPYSSSCPPIGGFMAPFYGGCAPLGFQPVGGDFLNSAYGSLPYQQPRNYFPSLYSLPMVNPMFTSSATIQLNSLAGPQPNGHDSRQSQHSCVGSNPRSDAISGRVRKFQASKDSEVQGSTGSNLCEQAGDGGKDGFHMPQAAGATNQTPDSCRQDSQNRVIRVVPHEARSATESAARIFRSIQRGKQRSNS